jgi:hypothetical protein
MNQQKRRANSGIVIMAVALFILVNLSWSLSTEYLGNTILRIPSSGVIDGYIQYVYGDKIYENGTEVVWRGVGASYLLHAKDYIEAWNRHLPEIQEMGLNTVRLAFRFPDSNTGADGYKSSDTLNYTMLDNVLGWLNLHGLKAILDCHNCLDMYGDFGSQKLINDWIALAGRYRFDPRIAAYELFNEPYWNTRDSSVRSQEDVARAYQTLTNEIRKVDPEHIVIWEAQPHLPVLETISEYFDANMVFTLHKWYDKEDVGFRIWNVTTFSFANIAGMVEMRSKVNKPFWLGEFGSYYPWNSSNPEWLLTNETLQRCEEQILGWSLWMHESTGEKTWDEYLQLFPLESDQNSVTRKPWILPLPNMLDSIISQRHSDIFEPCRIELRHNNDQVTFKGSNLVILVVTSHLLSDGSSETVGEQELTLNAELTITNEENTVNHPGDWKTVIYILNN